MVDYREYTRIWTKLSDINMNLFSILWITFWIVLIGLTHLKMDRKNLIEISHVVKYKEVFDQTDNVNKLISVQQGETINMSTGKSTVQYDKAKLYSIANKVRGESTALHVTTLENSNSTEEAVGEV